MKVAVINFSGNVGKTTVARHLLAPRIDGAEVIAVESINADDGQANALRGKQLGELQEYLQTVENVVVDIGASNVEDLLSLMHKYRGSHEDFDYFVIPTVPALKQQQDTIATLTELSRLGVPASKLRIVFKQVEEVSTWPTPSTRCWPSSSSTPLHERPRTADWAQTRSSSASREYKLTWGSSPPTPPSSLPLASDAPL